MHPAMFTDTQWGIMMFWYAALTGVCGGLLLISIVKSAYNYSRSALNPGIRVSFIEDIQRLVLAMGLIALAPTLLNLLIGLNDSLVWLCAKGLVYFVDAPEVDSANKLGVASMFEMIVSAILNTFNKIFNYLFGLKGLDDLIFNGYSVKADGKGVFGNIFAPVVTGNEFANTVLDFFMVIFNVYFNAVYTIRFWMITASITASPIVIWVWVLSGKEAVLEVFLGEIIQAVFMQASHALSLGIFMSIASGIGKSASLTGDIGAAYLSGNLAAFGVFVAGLAGSICVAVLVVMGLRLITANGEKAREEAKEGVKKALIGLIIAGLSAVIASVIAAALSGKWWG